MQHDSFGKPTTETIADIKELVTFFGSVLDVQVKLFFRTKGHYSTYRFYAVAYDRETGDELFESHEFTTKDNARYAFNQAGVSDIEDYTWIADDMVEFKSAVPLTSLWLQTHHHALNHMKAADRDARRAEQALAKTLGVIWNLFTAYKNEFDVEQEMSWPTFQLDYFEVKSRYGNADSVTLFGEGFKNGEPQQRTLKIPLIVLADGMNAVENFLYERCISDRAAYEQVLRDERQQEIQDHIYDDMMENFFGMPISSDWGNTLGGASVLTKEALEEAINLVQPVRRPPASLTELLKAIAKDMEADAGIEPKKPDFTPLRDFFGVPLRSAPLFHLPGDIS